MSKKDLYSKYFPKLYSYVFYLTKNKELAEDIASETFLDLYKFERYDDIQNKVGWLYQVARNKFSKYLAKQYRKKDFMADGNYDFAEIEASYKDMLEEPQETLLLKEELVSEINEEVSNLDPVTKEIIVMRTAGDMQFNEIAEVLDLKGITVRQRFYRAIEKIHDNIIKGKGKPTLSFGVIAKVLESEDFIKTYLPDVNTTNRVANIVLKGSLGLLYWLLGIGAVTTIAVAVVGSTVIGNNLPSIYDLAKNKINSPVEIEETDDPIDSSFDYTNYRPSDINYEEFVFSDKTLKVKQAKEIIIPQECESIEVEDKSIDMTHYWKSMNVSVDRDITLISASNTVVKDNTNLQYFWGSINMIDGTEDPYSLARSDLNWLFDEDLENDWFIDKFSIQRLFRETIPCTGATQFAVYIEEIDYPGADKSFFVIFDGSTHSTIDASWVPIDFAIISKSGEYYSYISPVINSRDFELKADHILIENNLEECESVSSESMSKIIEDQNGECVRNILYRDLDREKISKIQDVLLATFEIAE